MSEWETFCDECYYHMWRVRRKNERHFDDGYHVNNRQEAQALVELLNGLERERNEARATAKYWQEQYGHANPEHGWQALPWEKGARSE